MLTFQFRKNPENSKNEVEFLVFSTHVVEFGASRVPEKVSLGAKQIKKLWLTAYLFPQFHNFRCSEKN